MSQRETITFLLPVDFGVVRATLEVGVTSSSSLRSSTGRLNLRGLEGVILEGRAFLGVKTLVFGFRALFFSTLDGSALNLSTGTLAALPMLDLVLIGSGLLMDSKFPRLAFTTEPACCSFSREVLCRDIRLPPGCASPTFDAVSHLEGCCRAGGVFRAVFLEVGLGSSLGG